MDRKEVERHLFFCSSEQIQVFKLRRQFAFIKVKIVFINRFINFIKLNMHNEIISLILEINLIFINLIQK